MNCFAPVPSTVAIVTGAVLCAVGGIILHLLPEIIQDGLARNLALNPKSDIYKVWSTMPIPNYRQFYFFNYTNPDEFLSNWKDGVKPNVSEMGPYTYRIYEEKADIVFLEGDLIQYRVETSFIFQPNMSVGTPDDIVVTVNAPVVGMVGFAPEDMMLELSGVIYTADPTIFVQKSIRELLFDGYVELAVEIASKASGNEYLPENKFAYFYKVNNSKSDVHIIHRGNTDINDLGKIVQWNYTDKLPFWSGDCNNITGFVGPFPPGLGKRTIPLFSPDACRTLSVSFQKETEYLDVKLNRYVMSPEVFGDYNLEPDNACYCNDDEGTCYPSGLSNMAPCKMGVPVFLSMPHYLYGDFRLRKAIDGLSPDPEKHQTYIEIEPTTSAPFRVGKRAQSNILLKQAPLIMQFEDVPNMILPLFWIDECLVITDELADKLKDNLGMLAMAYNFPYFIMVIGGMLAILGVICSITVMFKKKTKIRPIVITPQVKVRQVASFVPVYH